jgi:hypothetical protein
MGSTIPLRIDSDLFNQARSAGAVFDRPPTAQLEHWAKLGRVLDTALRGESIGRVKNLAGIPTLQELVALTQSPAGQRKAKALIRQHAQPVYESDPAHPGLIIERRPDGTARRGRFANRKFVPSGRP